jgi:hypothetical protein
MINEVKSVLECGKYGSLLHLLSGYDEFSSYDFPTRLDLNML